MDRNLVFNDDVKRRFLSLAVRMGIDSQPNVRRFLDALNA